MDAAPDTILATDPEEPVVGLVVHQMKDVLHASELALQRISVRLTHSHVACKRFRRKIYCTARKCMACAGQYQRNPL